MSSASIRTIGRMRIAESLDLAFSRTMEILFRPFNVAIWFSFGAIIFLETQFRNFRIPFWGHLMPEFNFHVDSRDETVVDFFVEFSEYSIAITGISIVLLLGYTMYLVIAAWIQSRGQLMFVRALALDDPRVDVNWHDTRSLHRSLFIANLLIRVLSMILHVSSVCVALSLLSDKAVTDDLGIVSMTAVISIIAAGWSVGIFTLHLCSVLLRNFVVPLMIHLDISCFEACREFAPILKNNIVPVTLFFVILFVLHGVIGIVGVIVGIFTLFIGFLPIIHHTLLAPLYVMERAISMYMIQSIGADYVMVQPRRN